MERRSLGPLSGSLVAAWQTRISGYADVGRPASDAVLSTYGELHGRVTRESFAEGSAGETVSSPSGFRRSRQVPGPWTSIVIAG